jgi:hypothetical protein
MELEVLNSIVRQARFMIPMALSLGYGILFGSFISLLLVPCLYMIVEDAQRLGRLFRRAPAEGQAAAGALVSADASHAPPFTPTPPYSPH